MRAKLGNAIPRYKTGRHIIGTEARTMVCEPTAVSVGSIDVFCDAEALAFQRF